MSLLLAGLAAVILAMALALVRAVRGPTLYDRILAVNIFGTKTVVVVALIGFVMGRPEFLDIALFYALINFVGTVAVLKLSHYRELDATSDDGATA